MTEPLDAKPYLFVQKNFRTALSLSQFRPTVTTISTVLSTDATTRT